jgi:hypothetical protein
MPTTRLTPTQRHKGQAPKATTHHASRTHSAQAAPAPTIHRLCERWGQQVGVHRAAQASESWVQRCQHTCAQRLWSTPGAPAAAYHNHICMHSCRAACGLLVGTRKPLQRCANGQECGPLTASFMGPIQPRYMSTTHSQAPTSNSRNVSKAVTQVQKHTPLYRTPPPAPLQVHPAPPRDSQAQPAAVTATSW